MMVVQTHTTRIPAWVACASDDFGELSSFAADTQDAAQRWADKMTQLGRTTCEPFEVEAYIEIDSDGVSTIEKPLVVTPLTGESAPFWTETAISEMMFARLRAQRDSTPILRQYDRAWHSPYTSANRPSLALRNPRVAPSLPVVFAILREFDRIMRRGLYIDESGITCHVCDAAGRHQFSSASQLKCLHWILEHSEAV